MHGRQRRLITKRSLSVLSHALEEAALELGPSAAMISTFQYVPYQRSRRRTYDELDRAGVTTAVAYVGEPAGPPDHHVVVERDHPLSAVWAVVLVSDTLCGHVHAFDARGYGDTEGGLESARLFDAEIGFDPARSTSIARVLMSDLRLAGLSGEVADSIEHRLRSAAARERTPATLAWQSAMGVVATSSHAGVVTSSSCCARG